MKLSNFSVSIVAQNISTR